MPLADWCCFLGLDPLSRRLDLDPDPSPSIPVDPDVEILSLKD